MEFKRISKVTFQYAYEFDREDLVKFISSLEEIDRFPSSILINDKEDIINLRRNVQLATLPDDKRYFLIKDSDKRSPSDNPVRYLVKSLDCNKDRLKRICSTEINLDSLVF